MSAEHTKQFLKFHLMDIVTCTNGAQQNSLAENLNNFLVNSYGSGEKRATHFSFAARLPVHLLQRNKQTRTSN